LKQAQNRFADCIESCKAIDTSNKDKTILVPLTSSLYVPGKLADVEKVVVDIGTGYYVEKVRRPEGPPPPRASALCIGRDIDILRS